MYRVLLAIDADNAFAEQLADTVISLPDASNSVEVTVLHVHKDVKAPPSAAVQEPPRRTDPGDVVDQEVIPESVERVTDMLGTNDVTYTVRTERGDPAEEILRVADEIEADMIHIGGKKRSPAGKAIFGSVTQSVIYGTDLPVTIRGSSD